MAANFWKSSHCTKWIVGTDKLQAAEKRERLYLPEGIGTQVVYGLMMEVFGALKRNLNLKQQVLASAVVYFRRFYLNNSFTAVDPYLMAVVCMYLATKIEECGPIHLRNTIVNIGNRTRLEFHTIWPREPSLDIRADDVIQAEFLLMQELQCSLIIFHPYRALTQFAADARIREPLLSRAWGCVNDSYFTPLCLLHPPHMIALACLQIASTLVEDAQLLQWLSELNISITELTDIIQQLLDMYKSLKPPAANPQSRDAETQDMERRAVEAIRREANRLAGADQA
eukprot:m.42254 g.42254  ORF g.42254 m.42254 type:complete len:284 (-) comp5712_c1_seq2:140-991(-)